jgi:hypothetical protein
MTDDASRHAGAPMLDPAAVARQLRRLGSEPAAPWLHADIARRMAERLAVIKLQPKELLNWWGFLGDSREALDPAYPHARQLWVEPTDALRARSAELLRRPWWAGLARRAPAAEALAEAAVVPGAAQMLWANMMLHASPDMPAELKRWHAALAVDGFVMFSCFGPDSFRELRPLYRADLPGGPAVRQLNLHRRPRASRRAAWLHWFMLITCRDLRRRVLGDVLFDLEAPQVQGPQAGQLPRVGDGRSDLDHHPLRHRDLMALPATKVLVASKDTSNADMTIKAPATSGSGATTT